MVRVSFKGSGGTRTDEYDLLYEQFYGFEFEFWVTDIRKIRSMRRTEVEAIDRHKTIRDTTQVPIFVKCEPCDEYMDYDEGFFRCPKCKKEVEEMQLYELMDENLDYEEYWDEEL